MSRRNPQRRFVAGTLERRMLLSSALPIGLGFTADSDGDAQGLADQQRYTAHLNRATGTFVEINQEKRSAARAGGDAGANIALIEVYMADLNGNRVDTPAVGTNAFMFARFSTTDLAANASYTIRMTVAGVNRTTSSSSGAGLAGTHTYNVLLGDWIITTGFKSATIGLDSTGSVAETNEIDNSGVASFTPPVYAPKFSQMLEGNVGVDWFVNNYSDMNLTVGPAADYLGGPYQYDGHDAWDIAVANFNITDGGLDVFAAAPGTVIEAHDGEYDRNNTNPPPNVPANYVAIDHGGGWVTYYYHLRNESVAVNVGNTVTRGQQIGLMGSSGRSTGPHLHWSVYYNGMRVEPMVAEASYMQTPWGYAGNTKFVLDSGTVFHYASLDYGEGSVREDVINPGDGVLYWATTGGTRDGGAITVELRNPSGNVIDTVTGDNQYFGQSYQFNIGTAVGNYTIRLKIDGVTKDTAAFTITNATRPPEILVGDASFTDFSFDMYADNRWTPIQVVDRWLYDNRADVTGANGFYVNNTGGSALSTSNFVVPSGFSVTNALNASINPDGTDFVGFDVNRSVVGRRVGYASFSNNDTDLFEDTYRVRIEANIKSVNPMTAFPLHHNDDVYIRRNGSNVNIWVNADNTGDPTIIMPLSETAGGWLIGTGDGDDTITLDYTGGNPLADYAILAPGEGEEDTGDRLIIAGALSSEDIKVYGTQILVGTSDVRYAGFERVSVNSSAGADTITLSGSSITDDLDLNTQAITLNGGTGTDLLIIDDSDDTSNAEYSLRSSSFTRDGNFGTLSSYSSLETIRLDAGQGDNDINLTATVDTTINYSVSGGLGDDSLSNGTSDLSHFKGLITFNGSIGVDSLVVDDYNRTVGHDYVLESNTITRTDSGGYSYTGVDQLTILGGLGEDTFTMNSSVSGFEPFLFGNGGVDTFEIQGMFNDVTATISSGLGDDLLRVNADDSGTARVRLQSAEKFGTILVAEGGTLTLAPGAEANVLRATGITVEATGELNVTDNPVIIDYIVSPLLAIEADLRSGYNAAAWNGKGIRSSTAAGNVNRTLGVAPSTQVSPAVLTALGGGIDSTSLIIRYTTVGDLNLDRTTNFDDLLIMAQRYGQSNQSYSQGNLNYSADRLVSFDDLLILAQGYGTSLSLLLAESATGMSRPNRSPAIRQVTY